MYVFVLIGYGHNDHVAVPHMIRQSDDDQINSI